MADPEDDAMARDELAAALVPVDPPADERDRFLSRLRGRSRFAPFAAEIAQLMDVPLTTVIAALERVDDDTAWVLPPPPTPPMLPVAGPVVISRLPPGTRIPHHTHVAREVTYVLDGVLVADGVQLRRGRHLDMAAGSAHEVCTGGDEPCLVVAKLA